ncbi:MAG: nucleotidyltransferase domain-containing protein [Candidatus Micrarchaeota archaeon]
MDEKLRALAEDIRALFADAKIYLFGSRARGKARPGSDYDLIIVSNGFGRVSPADRPGLVWRHTWVGIAGDLLCYTPKEFKQVSKNSFVVKDALTYAVTL